MLIIKIIIILFILVYCIRNDIIKCHKNKKLKDILLIKRKKEIIKKIIENITFVKLISENYRYLINGRITVFANADNSYIKYIPLFCASLLYCDKRNRTDIEIAIDLNKLPKNIEKALQYLKNIYPQSIINIRYNAYKLLDKVALFNGKKVRPNSIRFLIEPKIKNEYIFIGDIDIIYLIENYYDNYLMSMFNRASCYSNVVRSYNSSHLSGIHFSKWYCFYPILLPKKINLMINDEHLLSIRLKQLGVIIDYKTKYRPIFGIHMSVNKPSIKKGYYHWDALGKKKLWEKFKNTVVFKRIYPLFDRYIKNKIDLLEDYYKNHK